MNDRRLGDLAGAILDGTPIDWSAAQSDTEDADRPLLDQLRVLAALADLYRDLPRPRPRAPLTADEPRDAGWPWGHLHVLERIGRGASCEVYRAWDTRLDREVALKLLPAAPVARGDPASSAVQEGRLLARVRHPNIVTVYGAEDIGDRAGLWMELVRGRTLKQIVDDGRVFSSAEATRIGRDLCLAVAAVHRAGLLHRDIKAQNVMLAEDGRVVLMDFGTGRELADHSASDLAGTPLYLAPEVLAGGDATVQSEVYSLGVLLYHLTTRSYPVQARSLHEVRRAHARQEQGSLRTAGTHAAVLPAFALVVERAIDPRPERRYQSAEALAAALEALTRRSTVVVRASAVALAVLMLGAALWWERPGPQPASAVVQSASLAPGAGGTDSAPSSPGRPRDDVDVEARELLGLLMSQRGVPRLEDAVAVFDKLIAQNPESAFVHAARANIFALITAPVSSRMSFAEADALLRPAALRAYALNRELPEANTAIGWMHARDGRWPEAHEAFRTAIAMNPTLTHFATNYVISTLQPLGLLDEALDLLIEALESNPGSLDVQREIGIVQLLAGNYEDAIATLQGVLDVQDDYPFTRVHMGRALLLAGRVDEAVRVLEELDGRHLSNQRAPAARRPPWLAPAYVATGRLQDVETLAEQHADVPSGLAIIYAALGDTDRTFDALERLAASQPHHVGRLLVTPELALIRGDTRLLALRARVGLPPP